MTLIGLAGMLGGLGLLIAFAFRGWSVLLRPSPHLLRPCSPANPFWRTGPKPSWGVLRRGCRHCACCGDRDRLNGRILL